ncbi:MAG: SH3 domain-containing protein, partial [Anaerolineae bacterium]|nr:SH3 domain-containing protein [Anaerolineae bacterium]
ADDMPDWATAQDEPEAEATDFDSILGMVEEEPAQSAYESDEELLAALGLGDDAADDTIIAEMPDWATAQDEPEAEATDFDSILGMVEEEPAQPAYESDEELLAALGLDDADEEESYAAAEMPDWTRQSSEPEAEVEDFGSMFDEVEAELTWAATESDEVEDELPEPDVTIEVKRTRPATDELPEWARLHYTQDDEEDLFGALKVTSRLPELPADDEPSAEPPGVADQFVETEAADYDAIFGGMDAQQDTGAPPGDDLFAQWASQTDGELLPEMSPEEDFFAELGAVEAAAPQPAATDADDIDWDNLYEPVTPRAQNTFAPADEVDAPPEKQDLFAQWATEAEMPPTEDFYSALDMIEPEQAAHEQAAAEPAYEEPDPLAWAQADVEAPPEADFFAALGMIDDKPPVEPSAPGFTDIDSYLASLPTRQAADVPEPTGFGQLVDLDLDAILSGSVFEDELLPKTSPFDVEPGMTEDWLAELHANVEEVSASAIVRQKEDRPVEELPSRLQRLRRLSEQVPEEAAPETALNEALPGVPNALAPAPFVSASPGLVQGVALTPEQQAKVDLLKSLVPVDEAPKLSRMSAIEATYDSPFMADLEDTPETVLQPVKGDAPDQKPRVRRPRRKRQPIRIDRLLIVAVLAAAVILPFFVGGFRIGSLPPAHFAAGSPAQHVFDQMEAIPPGALVLVGLEYSPASAAELDGMTDALVRHILLRAAYPVIVSGNPLGLLRSVNLIDSINDDADFLARIGATEPLQANDDYYIVRYLPGGVIGLRAFSQDTANMLLSDIRGQASRLVVRSLREFALVVVITDRAEDLRTYAEQIAPLTDSPLVSVVSYGAAPLAQPYADTLGGGLLVGLGDAYTYANTLGLAAARSLTERIRIIPTNTPSPTPAVTATPLPATGEPTVTTPPPTPTWTPEPLNATVISRQAVNMRSGPGTDNSVLAGVASGTTVLVLGFNDDGSWVNVQLDDGRTGWISVTLLEIHQGARANKQNHIPPRRQRVDEDVDPTATPRPPTAAPVVTDESTVEITDEVTSAPPTATATVRPTRTPSPTP